MAYYASLEDMIAAVFAAARPAERLTVLEVAQRYHQINRPGDYVGPWKLDRTPYLAEPHDVLTSLDYTGMIFVGPARTGKALALDTPIATPNGWSTMGDLKVGDTVFDENGIPTTVMATSEVMTDHDCYEVVFDDGTHIIADGDHDWWVQNRSYYRRKNKTEVRSTASMFESVLYGKQGQFFRYKVPNAKELCLPYAGLPLDPYFLGLWLGDGHHDRSLICLNGDEADHIATRIETVSGYICKRRPIVGANAERGCVSRKKGLTIAQSLRDLGLLKDVGGEKHIPPSYLRASAEQRREVLRGLMDSDGSALRGTNTVQLHTIYPRLAKDVAELVCSLGYKPHVKTWKNNSARAGKSIHVTFAVSRGEEVFSLPSKIAKIGTVPRRLGVTGNRSIVSIEKVESVPVKCIRVSASSHLFLAGSQMVPTHNSMTFLNWLAHTAMTDPSDMLLVHMTQNNAREWSKSDLDRMIRYSPKIKALLRPGRQNDNTFDKEFQSGMRLTVTWPTASNLSGKTIRRLWVMDYDRIADDIDGEGPAYDLTKKRSATFKRFGMTVAESSPGRDIEDPKWTAPAGTNEAPPTKGILSLYNRGDRRRWQWRCPQCAEPFEPTFKCLDYPSSEDFMESAEQVTMICPKNGCVMFPAMKEELNHGGRWVKEGNIWLPDGTMGLHPTVKPIRSDIASFWMKGPAASDQKWSSLVLEYLRAKKAYDDTLDEGPLRKTTNTDQGEPYISKSRESQRLPEELKDRAEDWGSTKENPTVPDGVRFLVATIDVQARAFVVQVQGVGVGNDLVVIDGFKIRKSTRTDDSGDILPIDPAAFAEDWDQITELVMKRSYELGDGSGRRMQIKLTGCDSGGREGVTHNAYIYWRRLRDAGDGLHRRLALVKGNPSKGAARVYVTWPDSKGSDKMAIAKGDVPVVMLKSDDLKDQIAGMLGRRVTEQAIGRSSIRYPNWFEDWFYNQLTTEVKTAKGWDNPANRRNEAWDLLYYCLGLLLRPNDPRNPTPLALIEWEKIDWNTPPSWAAEWDRNDLVFGLEEEPRFTPVRKKRDWSQLADELA